MTVFIYALIDPDTSDVRYIGKTVNPESRYRDHCNTGHEYRNPRKVAWVKALKSQGKKPVLAILEECTDEGWEEAESKWIKHYQPSILNTYGGGKNGRLIR
jgi:predicted GIY-YIG superfamily endonuclease